MGGRYSRPGALGRASLDETNVHVEMGQRERERGGVIEMDYEIGIGHNTTGFQRYSINLLYRVTRSKCKNTIS